MGHLILSGIADPNSPRKFIEWQSDIKEYVHMYHSSQLRNYE